MSNLATHILNFYQHFTLDIPPAQNIRVLAPFRESEAARNATIRFFNKYYADLQQRYMLIGINPGRFGSGFTGIPFTDPIRLKTHCAIPFEGPDQREASSVFIYKVIEAMGGPEAFYARYYFSSVSPLGFTKQNAKGRWVNYNYYDDPLFFKQLYPALVEALKQQIAFGMRSRAVCIGQGKNYQILKQINREFQLFQELIPLEHPRFIMQYRSGKTGEFVDKYVKTLQGLQA